MKSVLLHAPPHVAGRRIAVRGTVQGVGFRPWVYRLAHELGVGGRVKNDASGVIIDIFGAPGVLDTFVARLTDGSPGRIRALAWASIAAEPVTPFAIDASSVAGDAVLSIPPDLATCPECLSEIADPTARRFGYAFTNCTRCGPRFTIARGLPYDRPKTTMAGFALCPDCRREYDDPSDRRFHAQPVACPRCGPALWLEPAGDRDPLLAAATRLRAGDVVAVKGLGGWHLACDATSEEAVARLRARKRRDVKPFAVMIADLEAARAIAELGPADEELLAAPERPIAIVRRRAGCALAAGIAPDSPLVGLFLPYTPLHQLLLGAAARPLVMTSGNLADEPIAIDDEDAQRRLRPVADALLGHDRPIAARCDDSVARVIAGAPMVLRRSRGFVPRPVPLRRPVARPVLACGALLKNTFCLARGDVAYLGPHIGDLDNLLAYEAFVEAVERMERLCQVRPEVVAHDLHPDYPSTRYALERPGVERVAVQHHHAHVVATMAEHGQSGPVLGLAWDGTGLGTDGTAWGGELLLAREDGFRRLATFRPIALAGGDQAIRQVWRIALALLDDAFDGAPPLDRLPLFTRVAARDLRVVRQMVAGGLHSPRAHGVGRLFDGIGALGLGFPTSAYEGQVAAAWNNAAAPAALGRYPIAFDASAAPQIIDWRPLVRAVVGDLIAGVPPAVVSARFHRTLVDAGATAVRAAAAEHGRLPVVLSGGCFQNSLLTEGLLSELAELQVVIPRTVPPGDGGLALGQAVIAARRRS